MNEREIKLLMDGFNTTDSLLPFLILNSNKDNEFNYFSLCNLIKGGVGLEPV